MFKTMAIPVGSKGITINNRLLKTNLISVVISDQNWKETLVWPEINVYTNKIFFVLKYMTRVMPAIIYWLKTVEHCSNWLESYLDVLCLRCFEGLVALLVRRLLYTWSSTTSWSVRAYLLISFCLDWIICFLFWGWNEVYEIIRKIWCSIECLSEKNVIIERN